MARRGLEGKGGSSGHRCLAGWRCRRPRARTRMDHRRTPLLGFLGSDLGLGRSSVRSAPGSGLCTRSASSRAEHRSLPGLDRSRSPRPFRWAKEPPRGLWPDRGETRLRHRLACSLQDRPPSRRRSSPAALLPVALADPVARIAEEGGGAVDSRARVAGPAGRGSAGIPVGASRGASRGAADPAARGLAARGLVLVARVEDAEASPAGEQDQGRGPDHARRQAEISVIYGSVRWR